MTKQVYTKGAETASGQVSFAQQMEGLSLKKKADFLVWRIGDMTEKELSLQSWWPTMPAWDDLDEGSRAWAVEQLTAELDALEMMEKEQPGHAKWALTMRDKLLLYIEATNRITNYPAEVLDRPCTWAAWKRLMAEEVRRGR